MTDFYQLLQTPQAMEVLRALATSPSQAKRLLREVRILDKNGELSPPYRTPAASPSSSVLERAREALKRADQFIRNGVEFGFIRMPDAGCPDPAHDTPEVIRSALAEIDRALGGGNAE